MKRETKLERKLVITLNEREVRRITANFDLERLKKSGMCNDSKQFLSMLYLFNTETKRRDN